MADTDKDIALMAHLMRRAGFGAQHHELEALAEQGYEATVERLLHPEDHSNGIDMNLAERYFTDGVILPAACRSTLHFA